VLAIVGCVLFAILSKEQGLFGPLMLIAAIPLRRQLHVDPVATARPLDLAARANDADAAALDYAERTTPTARRFSGPPLLLFMLTCWLLAGYIIFRESILKFWWDRAFLDRTINPIVNSVGIDRALMPLALLGRYIVLLIAPFRLNPDYGGATIGSSVSFADPYLYLGAASVIALIVACALALQRRAWIIVFCIVCFGLIYGMIGNVLTLIGTNFGERLMYLPSIFFCIAAALLLARVPSRRVRIATVAVLVTLFAVRTITYAARWNDPPRLLSVAIDQHPRATRLYLLLAEDLHRRGDSNAAAETLARAREVDPTYYRVWINSAHLAMAMHEPDRALHFAREGQRLAPTSEGAQLIAAATQALHDAATRPATSEEDFFP
jgi:hypothetical protein